MQHLSKLLPDILCQRGTLSICDITLTDTQTLPGKWICESRYGDGDETLTARLAIDTDPLPDLELSVHVRSKLLPHDNSEKHICSQS